MSADPRFFPVRVEHGWVAAASVVDTDCEATVLSSERGALELCRRLQRPAQAGEDVPRTYATVGIPPEAVQAAIDAIGGRSKIRPCVPDMIRAALPYLSLPEGPCVATAGGGTYD